MGSPGVGGAISSASDTQISSPATNDLFVRNSSSRWQNIPLTDLAAQVTNGGVEKVSTIASAGAQPALNLSNGNVYNVTMGANVTAFNITGAVASKACAFTLYLSQPAGSTKTVNWALTTGNLLWSGGTKPTMTAVAGATDIYVFESIDGGANWYGSVVGQNFS